MTRRIHITAGAVLWAATRLFAQTQVHLQSQSKSADFANFPFVRPLPTGTTLPTLCSTGQGFFRTNAPAGQNLFWCTATNTWTEALGNGSMCQDGSGSGIAYACPGAGVFSYSPGLMLVLIPATTNTGLVTLNVSGLGARPLVRASGNGVIAGELRAGNAYLVVFTGASFVLDGEELEPDASGTVILQRGTFPHTVGLATNIFWSLTGANTPTGFTNLSTGQIRLPESTVAALPPASSNGGKEFMVTDGAATCDTATGGGSTRVFAVSNGASWLAPNCGGGGTTTFSNLCAGTGTSTSSTGSFTTLVSCGVGALAAGDALHLRAALAHNGGSTTSWLIQLAAGSAPLYTSGAQGATDARSFLDVWIYVTGSSSELLNGTYLRPNGLVVVLDFANTGAPYVTSSANLGSPFTFNLQGQMSGSTSETIGVTAWTFDYYKGH